MMEIDISNFTPASSLIGGVLIGTAINIFFFTTGRLAGVSGIINNLLFQKSSRNNNFLFIIGLVIGPFIYIYFSNNKIPFTITSSIPLIILGGLLVGIGTKIGKGCTSGHGVCGISLFSIRSIVATLIFMLFAIFTVIIIKFIGAY